MGWLDNIKEMFAGPASTPPQGIALESGPAVVTFHIDQRTKVQHFVVLKDFFCEELRSQYCADHHYNAREGDETLLRLLPEWKAAGKVSY
tara:strand:+ start:942 stop:1211 length:270 start_codon:yes stop_codon:yes gene_type:complete